MYVPEIYRNEDLSDILGFLRANGFAALVTAHGGHPWATHLPLMLREANGKIYLHGHLAKENPQSAWLESGDVLAIFSGPDAYISSSWYDHENVPTWNYVAVHLYGRARILDYDETVSHLAELTRHYERGSEKPVSVEELSEKTMRQARGVTAFEIEVTRIDAKRKLSQNRDDANHGEIIAQLQKRGKAHDKSVADEMRRDRSAGKP